MKLKQIIILGELEDGKVYQLALKTEVLLSIAQDLPNFFPTGVIPILPIPLELTLEKRNK